MESVSSSAVGRSRLQALVGAMLCNAFEWYDFAIYGILALYISQAFFPGGESDTRLLQALAVFGVSFLLRPLGGLVLGGIGDRYGRKPALIITAGMMAFGTMTIGLIPTYERIGLLSPALLLVARLLQGLSAGGEWGAANAFLVEWSPPAERGFWTSFLSVTVALGSGLASGIAAVVISLLPPQDMASWGWRVPFLIGGLLCLVGLWLRTGVDETPAYLAATRIPAPPEAATLRSNLKPSIITFGLAIHWTVCYYILLIYMPLYTRSHTLTSAQAVWSNTVSTIVIIFLVPLIGMLSDRLGRRPFLAASCVSIVLLTVPAFWLIATMPSFPLVVAIQAVFGVTIALYSGAAPAATAEHYSIYGRSRWSSVSYAIATAIFGGFAPFIAVWLTKEFDSALAPTIYLMTASLLSLLVVFLMPETARKPLR